MSFHRFCTRLFSWSLLLLPLASFGCDTPSPAPDSETTGSTAAANPQKAAATPQRLSAALAELESLSPVSTAAKDDYFLIGQGMASPVKVENCD